MVADTPGIRDRLVQRIAGIAARFQDQTDEERLTLARAAFGARLERWRSTGQVDRAGATLLRLLAPRLRLELSATEIETLGDRGYGS
jgi:hypothetical protein